jgi:hypothetical protein
LAGRACTHISCPCRETPRGQNTKTGLTNKKTFLHIMFSCVWQEPCVKILPVVPLYKQ